MKNIVLASIAGVLLVCGAALPVNAPKEYRLKKIVIDAGHGGKDPGTSGTKLVEKEVVMDIAEELGNTIKEHLPGVEVIYTRDTDVFVELAERANMANKQGADLFISIHANSNDSHQAYGTESWVMGLHRSEDNLEVAKRENSVILLEQDYRETYQGYDPTSPESHMLFALAQNAYLQNSLKLAHNIQNQMSQRVNRRSRGVKQAGFLVLHASSMPSVLFEVGFLTNPKEEQYLSTELGRTYIAHGLFRAIRDYKEELES